MERRLDNAAEREGARWRLWRAARRRGQLRAIDAGKVVAMIEARR